MQLIIHQIAGSIAITILSFTWWMLNPQTEYVPVDWQSVKLYPDLRYCTYWTIFCAAIQSALTAILIWKTQEYSMVSIAVFWTVLLVFSRRLNFSSNAFNGGHLSIFTALLIVFGGSIFNLNIYIRDLKNLSELQLLVLAILGLNIGLILTFGFWHHREKVDDDENISREKGASIFSSLFFTWVSPLIAVGSTKHLEMSDVWNLIDIDSSEIIVEKFKTLDSTNSLLWNLCLLSLPYLLFQGLCSILSTVLSFASPYFLYQIIESLNNDGESYYIILCLLGMFLSAAISSILYGQTYFSGRRFGLRARVALVDQIYQKALQRANSSREDDENASVGKIVNLMSVDTERINIFLSYYHDLMVRMPISIIISIGSLFLIIGWSAIVGVLLAIFLGTLSSALGKWVMRLQTELLKSTDSRVSVMNELLAGIRIVKYFSWEEYFKDKVSTTRKIELKNLIKLWGGRLIFATIGSGSGVIIALSTFATYTLIAGQSLDAAKAFTSINLLRIVSQLLSNLPYHVMILFNAFVSFERIEKFMKEKNIERFDESKEDCTVFGADVGFENATFRYHTILESGNEFELRDMNVKFPVGKLSVICGPTGSGKSSMLLALLGELDCTAGKLLKRDGASIAYGAQTAWLLNATIRENILFGCEYNADRYEAVVRGCALAKDFANLEGGDLTEVGEKGINLSGGQKQRISLARVCYSKASIVILDDPLSAVDPPTARFLLKNCLLDLLEGRTILLVTHATHLVLPYADFVVVVNQGVIAASGTPKNVIERSVDYLKDVSLEKNEDECEISEDDLGPVATPAGEGTTLVQEEEKASGSVKLKLYAYYLLASGGVAIYFCYALSYVLAALAKVFNDWWLKYWTDHSETLQHIERNTISSFVLLPNDHRFQSFINSVNDENSALYYVLIYALFGAGMIFAEIIQTVVFLVGSLWASIKLHDGVISKILGAPLRFFETTPIGRILNRVSRDVEAIDSNVMFAIRRFLQRIIQILTIVGLISVVSPMFLLFTPAIAYFFIRIARQYLNASRELKRYESTTKSPIYAQFSETLTGVSTIRAYGASRRFSQMCNEKVDFNNRPYFFVWAANRWLSIRTDFMAAFVVFCSGAAVLISNTKSGWAALAITYALDFSDSLLWTVRMHAEMEMSMNSVERIEEYSKIEQEDPSIIENNRPPAGWPRVGEIVVKDLRIKYAPDLPDVLKGVSFEIKDGEKVAVVGRTGAGKSTLSLAFYRIVPIFSGLISIDGIDISQIGLKDLRSNLTIIPQDPILFTGSLRSNLDPLGRYDEQTLWDTLKRVHFIESVQTGVCDLDIPVAENGSNFSLGQRQLICLARSLLQGNRIIFLDEATASVDGATDAKIQQTIRTEFKQKTIICIAHRLRTIIDYDKVLVLDKGNVVEFGSPISLIKKDGVFNSMCEESGEYEELVEIAMKNKHFSKYFKISITNTHHGRAGQW